MCKLRVGDPLNIPPLSRLDGEVTEFETLSGSRATVVLFWSSDGWMSRAALHDFGRDVVANFDPKSVSVVGVAVETSTDVVRKTLQEIGAEFPQLIDVDGAAMGRVGTGRIPRIYVLDEVSGQRQGKSIIAWFDIEYSEASRRELRRTLVALTKPAEGDGN
jgi:hypothetical protein